MTGSFIVSEELGKPIGDKLFLSNIGIIGTSFGTSFLKTIVSISGIFDLNDA